MARSRSMQVVIETCLTHAESLPPMKRAELYRCMAESCGTEQEAADLVLLASDLESADRRCREFAFRITTQGKP